MDRRRKREGVYEVAKNTQDRRDEEDIMIRRRMPSDLTSGANENSRNVETAMTPHLVCANVSTSSRCVC